VSAGVSASVNFCAVCVCPRCLSIVCQNVVMTRLTVVGLVESGEKVRGPEGSEVERNGEWSRPATYIIVS